MTGAPPPVLLEVCVETVAGARAAQAAGAQRIELCGALSEGGLTPSLGLVQAVRAAVGLDLVVLARPRRGDFLYDDDELDVLRRDVEALRDAGADGVALGMLDADGRVDRARCAALIAAARPLPVTFHRAFDLARDADEALDALLELGVERLLTSGQAPSAEAGAACLARLVERAGAGLTVIAAGGVCAENAPALVRATGVREVHASVGGLEPSSMRHRPGGVAMGGGAPQDEFVRRVTDPRRLAALAAALGLG